MKARYLVVPVGVVLVLLSAPHAFVGQEPGGDAKDKDVETLARKSGCLECHTVDKADKKLSGPTFRDIAARNKDEVAARNTLEERVKNGSKGKWTEVSGGVPMPPYSALLTEAEIAQLVDWVLRR
jgi:cytochrome c551/c552